MSQVRRLRVWRLAIPLRKPFVHAAHSRSMADPVVVEVELADGTVGYGETLARPYVTGEMPEMLAETIESSLVKELLELRPERFADALERIEALPIRDEAGAIIAAARAAVELALLDAYSRHFRKPISEVLGWIGLPGFGPPGSTGHVTYSGVLTGEDPQRLAQKTRMMHWYGLRDFKLKVGYSNDAERVAKVARTLGSSLGKRTTLRLDANSAWTVEQAISVLRALPDVPIACVEQPLARTDDGDLATLRAAGPWRIMPDESLITMEDARRLTEAGVVDCLNIRISKNGGFLPAIQLAHFARQHRLDYQLGCMVGETSILSAAGRHYIENVPGIRFAEGSYGRFLLNGDIVDRRVQFGCRGTPRPMNGLGWGIEVRTDLLRRHAVVPPIELRL